MALTLEDALPGVKLVNAVCELATNHAPILAIPSVSLALVILAETAGMTREEAIDLLDRQWRARDELEATMKSKTGRA